MRNLKLSALFIIASWLLASCEDPIDVELNDGLAQLNIDAFLSNDTKDQQIKLTLTNSYFNNTAPQPALGAQVLITDQNGRLYTFDDMGDGTYVKPYNASDSFAQAGYLYTLEIRYNGEVYTATELVNPVPPIDSLVLEEREAEFGDPEGIYATFFAFDIPDREDFYWIRTYRNDSAIDRNIGNLNISQDAAFNGNGADGFLFILPIREAITPRPYNVGDSIRVELWSISEETFGMFSELQNQLANAGLFAVPPANISTNIANSNPNSKINAVGWFSMSNAFIVGTTVR